MSEKYTAWEEELITPDPEQLEGLCPTEISDMIENPIMNIWEEYDEFDEEEYMDEEDYY